MHRVRTISAEIMESSIISHSLYIVTAICAESQFSLSLCFHSHLNVMSIETGKSSRSVLTAFQRFWNFLMSLASLSAQLQQHFLTVPIKRLKLRRPSLWFNHRAEINKNHNEENLWPSPSSLINTVARAVLVKIKIPKKWHDDIIYLKIVSFCLMGWQAC